MHVVLIPLLDVISIAIHLFIWVLIISAALSWLVAFNIINTRNRAVYTIMDALYRVTNPALRPIRRFLPDMGGLDVSPVVLILILYFVQRVISEVIISLAT
jgi:YggT family protein